MAFRKPASITTRELRAAVDAANRSNVSLYTVDARGLARACLRAATLHPPALPGAALYSGSAVHSQITSLQGSRDTLATLATDTGGKTFYDLNDFGEAFRVVQSENSSYYLLGYSPANTRRTGASVAFESRSILPGVKIEARPGYFAPKDFRQFTRQDKEMQLQQAMELDTALRRFADGGRDRLFPPGLPIEIYVVLAAKIPGLRSLVHEEIGDPPDRVRFRVASHRQPPATPPPRCATRCL